MFSHCLAIVLNNKVRWKLDGPSVLCKNTSLNQQNWLLMFTPMQTKKYPGVLKKYGNYNIYNITQQCTQAKNDIVADSAQPVYFAWSTWCTVNTHCHYTLKKSHELVPRPQGPGYIRLYMPLVRHWMFYENDGSRINYFCNVIIGVNWHKVRTKILKRYDSWRQLRQRTYTFPTNYTLCNVFERTPHVH